MADCTDELKRAEGPLQAAEDAAAAQLLEGEPEERLPLPRQKRWESLRTFLLLLAALTLFTYLYAGFYYPDPHFYRGPAAGGHRLLLMGVRILLPLLGLAALLLYAAVRSRRIPLSALGLVSVGLVLGMLLLHSIGSVLYFRSLSKRSMEGYHPFLQLSPPDIEPFGSAERSPTVRILALGGSSTAWPDTGGRSWPALVEQRLNRDLSAGARRVEVRNAAKEWYTTAHTLINYSLNLRHLKPDVILVTHAINDLLMNADFNYLSARPFAADYRHSYGPLLRVLTPPKDPFLNAADKLRLAWFHEPRRVVQTESFPGLSSFRRNLETLIDYARRDGVKVVLITQPYLLKQRMTREEYLSLHMVRYEAVGPAERWGVRTALSGMRQYDEAVRSIARDRGAELIDLEPIVPKTAQYFSDEVHYKDSAFPLIAEFVSRELERCGVLREQGGGA